MNYLLNKLAYKTTNCDDWPSYLKLEEYIPIRTLRSSSAQRLVVLIISGTFQDEAAPVFNYLPEEIRNCDTFKDYCRNSCEYFKTIVKNRISDTS
jgi:hypothetical protein